mgnify:CR=1 FL=1
MTLRVLNPRQTDGALTGWHVLMIVVGFFGLIFAVNGYFLYKALSTHTGVVASEPYRRGLEYNRRIAASEQQAGLGWSENLTVEHAGRVSLTLRREGGEPVRGLIVEGRMARPSTGQHDRLVRFVEQDGSYVAEAGQLADGTWIVDAAARTTPGQEPVYRLRKRIWLKP